MRIVLHLGSPYQKSPQVDALPPQKLPELKEPNLLHFYAAVGLNAPKKIRAAPGREPVAASGVPHESQDVAHDQNGNRSF
jgi:hypothetical protein